jgi:hypothetical protein
MGNTISLPWKPTEKKDLPCKGLDINPKLAVLEKSTVITEVAISGVNMLGAALKVSLIGYPLGSILMGLSNIIAVGVKKYNENVKLDSLFRELMFIIFSIKMLFLNEIKQSSNTDKNDKNNHWEKTMYNIKYHLVNISLIINKLIGIKKRGNNNIAENEADCKEIISDIKKADPDNDALTGEAEVKGGGITDMLSKLKSNIPFVNSVLKPDIFIDAIHDELTLLNSYLILHIQSNNTINDDGNLSKKEINKLKMDNKKKEDDLKEQISELAGTKNEISNAINNNNEDNKLIDKLKAKINKIDTTIEKLNKKIEKLKEDESKYNTSSGDLDKIREKLNNTTDITQLVKEFESDLSGYEDGAKKFLNTTIEVTQKAVEQIDEQATNAVIKAAVDDPVTADADQVILNIENENKQDDQNNNEIKPANKEKEVAVRLPEKTGGKLRHTTRNTRKKRSKLSTPYRKTRCNKK